MSERTMLAMAYHMGFEDGIMLRTPDGSKATRLENVAVRVVTHPYDTDFATGRCECGGCQLSIDPWDAYCRHCGARLEDE